MHTLWSQHGWKTTYKLRQASNHRSEVDLTFRIDVYSLSIIPSQTRLLDFGGLRAHLPIKTLIRSKFFEYLIFGPDQKKLILVHIFKNYDFLFQITNKFLFRLLHNFYRKINFRIFLCNFLWILYQKIIFILLIAILSYILEIIIVVGLTAQFIRYLDPKYIWTCSYPTLFFCFFLRSVILGYLRSTYVYKTSTNLQFFTHIFKIPRFSHSRIKIPVFPNFIFRFYLLPPFQNRWYIVIKTDS